MTFIRHNWFSALLVDLVLLAVAAPILYLPQRFGSPAVAAAVGLLTAGWLWRRMRIGIWRQPTAADWPIAILLFVMLPIAVWIAPEPLRTQYAWPRALVLLWNYSLFTVVVTYASRWPRLLSPILNMYMSLAVMLAMVAPFGTNWLFKLPGVDLILTRLPPVFGVLSREGGSGFHHNVIAGALLFVLPLMVALTVVRVRQQRLNLGLWLLLGATLYVFAIFILLQSRGGYVGLAVALLAMPAVHTRWGRRLLALGVFAAVLLVFMYGEALLQLMADNPGVEAVGGISTLANFRINLWTNALQVIRDYPFTGVGLGAFQTVASLFYPLAVPRDFYFGHAHNFWLQGAIDFGLPGLAAILALYMVVVVQLLAARRARASQSISGLLTGLFGCLVAQSTFSLTDSISLGTTANFFFWFLIALILALGNIAARQHQAGGSS